MGAGARLVHSPVASRFVRLSGICLEETLEEGQRKKSHGCPLLAGQRPSATLVPGGTWAHPLPAKGHVPHLLGPSCLPKKFCNQVIVIFLK